MSMADPVNVVKSKKLPDDYHCSCKYCKKYIGELRPADGSYYSRLERRQYYAPSEKGKGGHIAKTPLHIARWAIQAYTEPGDWVLDPTIGAGTTAVEAITQGRSAAGMELEYGEILRDNLTEAMKHAPNGSRAEVASGDARTIGKFLKGQPLKKKKFALVVNNPPYSGDISMPSPKGKLRGKEHRHLEVHFEYDEDLPNLAFLGEGAEYWTELLSIYGTCADRLVPGGHFVVGVKDMMRKKEPFFLHRDLCTMIESLGSLEFVGTALLKHHPRTLFLNTYEKMYGVKPPFYQTISVFRKEG